MTETKKLTQANVRDLPLAAKGERYSVNDAELPGFGVRIGARDKSYIVWGRVNGRKRMVTIGSSDVWTAEDARKHAKGLMTDMSRGDDPNHIKAQNRLRSTTLGEAAQSYVDDNAKLKPQTRIEYVETLKRNLNDWWDKPLDSITPDMVMKRYNKLAERAPTQADITFRYFRAVFNGAAAVIELMGDAPLPNPTRILTLKKAWKPLVRRETAIPTEQIGAWWNACDGDGDRLVADAFRFMLLTGWRKSEVLNLRWRDVNMKANTVTARDTKNKTHHTLPVGNWLLSMLTARKQQSGGKHDYVFESDKGRLSNLRYFQDDMLARTGLWITPHDLRRTFASMAAGMFPSYVVKKLLNHAASNDVTQGYIIQSVADLRVPMQTIEDNVLRHAGTRSTGNVIQLRAAG